MMLHYHNSESLVQNQWHVKLDLYLIINRILKLWIHVILIDSLVWSPSTCKPGFESHTWHHTISQKLQPPFLHILLFEMEMIYNLLLTTSWRQLTVHPLMSCLLTSASCSNSVAQTVTLPSLAAYISGDMRYLQSGLQKKCYKISECQNLAHNALKF